MGPEFSAWTSNPGLHAHKIAGNYQWMVPGNKEVFFLLTPLGAEIRRKKDSFCLPDNSHSYFASNDLKHFFSPESHPQKSFL